ncbi:MAG: hypothetical protein ABI858_01820 [Pseudoxanthomonas sp.]
MSEPHTHPWKLAWQGMGRWRWLWLILLLIWLGLIPLEVSK